MNIDAMEVDSLKLMREAERVERKVELEATKKIAAAEAGLSFVGGLLIGFGFGFAAGVYAFALFLEKVIQ